MPLDNNAKNPEFQTPKTTEPCFLLSGVNHRQDLDNKFLRIPQLTTLDATPIA